MGVKTFCLLSSPIASLYFSFQMFAVSLCDNCTSTSISERLQSWVSRQAQVKMIKITYKKWKEPDGITPNLIISFPVPSVAIRCFISDRIQRTRARVRGVYPQLSPGKIMLVLGVVVNTLHPPVTLLAKWSFAYWMEGTFFSTFQNCRCKITLLPTAVLKNVGEWFFSIKLEGWAKCITWILQQPAEITGSSVVLFQNTY